MRFKIRALGMRLDVRMRFARLGTMNALGISAKSSLLTDLYQLTMADAYLASGMNGTAVFEFFVRKLPHGRRFLLAAGLEQAIEFLEGLRFEPEDLEWLASTGRFSAKLLDYLLELKFEGDVDAIPEGTPFFADEPILRVRAPIPLAQLIESRLINLLQLQVLIASKAIRCVLAAPGKLLIDFGMRRAHGFEAALLAARACFLAGFAGTSTVLAGRAFGIPLYGTMAHSFVEAHETELEAFFEFARNRRTGVTLLIDTYDTESGAKLAARAADELTREGIRVSGVRIDSGDLAWHAREVRRILDQAGHPEIRIYASGSLDEDELVKLAPAPIDGFGVGTRLLTSADRPYLDCAYKLTEYAGRARRKRSEEKATWPGAKQVYRARSSDGSARADLIALENERGSGDPLVRPILRAGRRVAGLDLSLESARRRAQLEVSRLPERVRRLAGISDEPYPVAISAGLRALAEEINHAHRSVA